MPKTTKRPESKLSALTVECLCGADEMVLRLSAKNGYRQFLCPSCKSNLWLSPIGFEEADRLQKIMER